mgnify:FL=1
MRPDGTRVKDLPPLVAAIPYIMPKRYDAWNSITENVDEEAVKAYIRHWRGRTLEPHECHHRRLLPGGAG